MRITGIKWDVSDLTREEIAELYLPEDIIVLDMEEDEIADYLSDHYGFCVESFAIYTDSFLKEIQQKISAEGLEDILHVGYMEDDDAYSNDALPYEVRIEGVVYSNYLSEEETESTVEDLIKGVELGRKLEQQKDRGCKL